MQKKMVMPFNFIPAPLMDRLSFRFYGVGNTLANMLPATKASLYQVGLAKNATDYFAKAIILFLCYWVFLGVVFGVIASKAPIELSKGLVLAGLFSLILAGMILFNLMLYPKLLVDRRVKDVEKNWVYALRTLLVQVKSGLSLFDAMNVIVQGNYGAVSEEIRKALDEMNAGTPEGEALEKMAEANPSIFFKRSIWQLINGMEAGISIEDVLESVVQNMVEEEKNAIKKYGSKLGVFSLVYVMIGVIIPALGITFLIVLSNFPQINISENLLWLLLGLVVLLQFLYLGLMKSIRPGIIEG